MSTTVTSSESSDGVNLAPGAVKVSPRHETAQPLTQVPFNRLLKYFLRLGTTGFGGPIAVVGYMQRDLVDQRRWISEDDFLDGVALGQTLPGPLAAQVAMWIGYLRRGTFGAFAIAVAFIVPSFLMVTVMAVFYTHFSAQLVVRKLFMGVSPAVLAIMGITAYKLLKITDGRDRRAWAISAVVAAVTIGTGNEPIYLIIIAGLLMIAVDARPGRGWWGRLRSRRAQTQLQRANGNGSTPSRLPALSAAPLLGLGAVATTSKLTSLALFFFKTGAVTFGFGLAVVPVMRSGVIDHYHWLNSAQFLNAIAIGLITPGPVVITATFIGYLVAGPMGAIVATVAIFTPIYLAIIIPGRLFIRYRDNKQVRAFVKGATAATAGALIGMVLVLPTQAGLHGAKQIIGAVVMTSIAVGLLLRFKKLPEMYLVLAFAGLGLLLPPG